MPEKPSPPQTNSAAACTSTRTVAAQSAAGAPGRKTVAVALSERSEVEGSRASS